MPTVTRLLQDQVTLTCECLDRIYLNCYVPTLQTPRALHRFYGEYRGNPIVSLALCEHDTTRIVQAVDTFALRYRIPVVHFPKGARKEEIAQRYFTRFRGSEGVVLIGVAQERMRSFRASKTASGQFHFARQPVSVKHTYFTSFRSNSPSFQTLPHWSHTHRGR
jgi:hypothetical protein